MRHIEEYDGFTNEQLVIKNTFADIINQANDVFKSSGFGDFLGNISGDAPLWGIRLSRGGSAKTPSTAEVQANMKILNETMTRHGITDKKIRAAIQGVIGKECGWSPEVEESYANTPNDRIRGVFDKRVRGLSDAQLNTLKANDTKFWDRIYGPDDPTGAGRSNGNTDRGDGGKYRGRGFNGLTFKNEYKKMQDIYNSMGKSNKTIDIVSNPDSLNDPEVAAEIAVLYFLSGLQSPKIKQLYGTNDPNKFRDQETATKAIFQINAGLGQDLNKSFFQDTLSKANSLAIDSIEKNLV